jgi:twitching motility protein PilT
VARLDSFLRLVSEQQVSDLHFHAGSVPIVRYNGELLPLPFRVLSELEARRFLFEVLTPSQQHELQETHELDFTYELADVGRFRGSAMLQRNGFGVVFRVIPRRVPTLDELWMPPSVKRLTRLTSGLLLVTGPTGCGKTTTLAAMVDEINTRSQRHVITVEDPIEYQHQPKQSVITQRQVGRHSESFASALRSALRESPDVLVVGELRDPETVALAVAAAETGILVLGTLHSNSAAKAIDRIIDVTPEETREQTRSTLSVLLRGVVAQHLCRRADGEGRVAALEILLQSYAIANLIREGKVHQIEGSLDSSGDGMQSLDACILRLVSEGTIALEEGMKVANDAEKLKRLATASEEEPA